MKDWKLSDYQQLIDAAIAVDANVLIADTFGPPYGFATHEGIRGGHAQPASRQVTITITVNGGVIQQGRPDGGRPE